MSTEFNYVVNVDTSRVMGAMSEVRSQMGMALGSPSGFSTFSDAFAGGRAGMAQMMDGFRGAHSAAAAAFSNAHTTADQEAQIAQGGVGAAYGMRPPGTSAAAFAMSVMENRVERESMAMHEGTSAAVSTFATTAGGMVAGYAGWKGAGAILGGLAKVGLKSAGGIAGFGLQLAASFAGEHFSSEAIGKFFEEKEQAYGISKELGEVAGAGRGLTGVQRATLGGAAFSAAKDLKLDFDSMANILALGREAGIMPTANGDNSSKAKEQYKDFARTIDEGAQMLQTSLSGATQVVKNALAMGMSAQEGLSKAAGMGIGAFNQMGAFGNLGASVAEANFLGRDQGRGLFMGAYSSVGAGINGAEMRMLGGRTGAAQLVGTTAMGAVLSPMGDMQLLAASTGQALGGPLETASLAMDALSSGDMVSNMLSFNANKDRMRRGIGASGVRAMTKQQIQGYADMLQDFAPDLSDADARSNAVMNLFGQNATQARATVGAFFGGRGGGPSTSYGGMTAEHQADSIMAHANVVSARNLPSTPLDSESGGWKNGLKTAAAAAVGTIPVPGVGWGVAGLAAVGGFAYGYVGGDKIKGFVKGVVNEVSDGVTALFTDANAEELGQARLNADEARKDAKKKKMEEAAGIRNFDSVYIEKAIAADLSGARLDMNLGGTTPAALRHRSNAAAALQLGGYEASDTAGAGKIRIGDMYYRIEDYQAIAKTRIATTIKEKRGEEIAIAAGGVLSDSANSDDILAARDLIHMINKGDGGDGAASKLNKIAKKLAIATGDKKLAAAFKKGGLQSNDPEVRRLLYNATGNNIDINSAVEAGMSLGHAASLNDEKVTKDMDAYILARLPESIPSEPRRAAAEVMGEQLRKGKDLETARKLATVVAGLDPAEAAAIDQANLARVRNSTGVMSVSKHMSDMLAKRNGAYFDMDGQIATDAVANARTRKDGIDRKRRAGSNSVENRVGFGQNEDAMSSINRSLKLTEKAIAELHKKIKK